MEWDYKNITIDINTNGVFSFNLDSKRYTFPTLLEAKSQIDKLLKDYYKFTKEDYDKLTSSIPAKYKEFITSLISELYFHSKSSYCSVEWDFDFDIDFKKILDI